MRSEPIITVVCDECGDELEIGLTTTGRGYDERNVDGDLKNAGWISDGWHDFCSIECKNAYENVELG